MRNIILILKCHLLHQVNALAHLLCHVTYVTAFKKSLRSFCLNLQNIQISFLYEQDIPKYVRYPAKGNVFKYLYLNNTYQIRLLKTGSMGCLIIPPQTLFVVGILFSRCPSIRQSVRPSVTFCFLNILKSHCWNFIKLCKHDHIYKPNTLNKK